MPRTRRVIARKLTEYLLGESVVKSQAMDGRSGICRRAGFPDCCRDPGSHDHGRSQKPDAPKMRLFTGKANACATNAVFT
jgi:hypothetical protein